MVKFGQLFTNNGMYGSKRIISESYIKEATSHHQPHDMEINGDEGYGYCWWLANHNHNPVMVAMGYAGQIIAISQRHNTVITLTHNWRVSGKKADEQQQYALKKILIPTLEGILAE